MKLNSLLISFSGLLFFGYSFGQGWDQVQKITASNRTKLAEFGYSSAINNDYIVISAAYDPFNETGLDSMEGAGAVYLFQKNDGIWQEFDKIIAYDRKPFDWFGISVSIFEKTILIGSGGSYDENTENFLYDAGCVYIYEINPSLKVELYKIVPTDRRPEDVFGASVSIHGNYAIIGAIYHDYDTEGANYVWDAGAAYIFEKNSGDWIQAQKLVGTDRVYWDEFGVSVAINDEYAVVGATEPNATGSVYIYQNIGSYWQLMQKISPENFGNQRYFGKSVSISNDYIIVGAERDQYDINEENALLNAGAVYFLKNIDGTWEIVQKVVAPCRMFNAHFGYSVSIKNDFAIVSSPYEKVITPENDTIENAGAAYIYKNVDGTWELINSLTNSISRYYDFFGKSVAISQDYALVGANGQSTDIFDNDSMVNSGSAYIYKNNSTQIINIEENSVLVYPNPTNKKITLDFSDMKVFNLKISDLSGRILIENNSHEQLQSFDLSDFEAGIYVLNAQTDSGFITKKIVRY